MQVTVTHEFMDFGNIQRQAGDVIDVAPNRIPILRASGMIGRVEPETAAIEAPEQAVTRRKKVVSHAKTDYTASV